MSYKRTAYSANSRARVSSDDVEQEQRDIENTKRSVSSRKSDAAVAKATTTTYLSEVSGDCLCVCVCVCVRACVCVNHSRCFGLPTVYLVEVLIDKA